MKSLIIKHGDFEKVPSTTDHARGSALFTLLTSFIKKRRQMLYDRPLCWNMINSQQLSRFIDI